MVISRLFIDLSRYDPIPIALESSVQFEAFSADEQKVQQCTSRMCILADSERFDVVSFLVSEELCAEWRRVIADVPEKKPNSMHSYGKVLIPAMNDVICSIVRSILPDLPTVRRIHAFYVKYDASSQTSLGMHTDDSTYTINICLSNNSIGSDLVFDSLNSVYRHTAGRGIVHSGLLPHHVTALQSGTRENIIIWVSRS